MPLEIMRKEYLAFIYLAGRLPTGEEVQNFTKGKTLATKFRLSVDHPDYEHYSRFSHDALPNVLQLPVLVNREPLARDYVSHNYQHDLESLWWIAIYFITGGVGHKPSENQAREIFHNHPTAKIRAPWFRDSLFGNLMQCLRLELATYLLGPLEMLRISMLEEYVQRVIFREMNVHESYSSIHAAFAEQLDVILDNVHDEWKRLPIIPMKHHPDGNELAPGKRAAADDDDDDGADGQDADAHKRARRN